MKLFKRLASCALAALLAFAALMPAQPVQAAAVKPKIKSVKLYINGFDENGEESSCAFLSMSTSGKGVTTGYQYKVYVNGKKYGSTKKSEVYDADGRRCCKVVYPADTAVTVSVRVQRGGAWSAWSGRIAIVPIVPTLGEAILDPDARTVSVNWGKVKAVTDYAIYVKAGKNGKWKKVTTSKKTKVTFGTYDGSHPFRSGTTYYYKIVARKKVNGKYVGSKLGRITDYDDYIFEKYSYFRF